MLLLHVRASAHAQACLRTYPVTSPIFFCFSLPPLQTLSSPHLFLSLPLTPLPLPLRHCSLVFHRHHHSAPTIDNFCVRAQGFNSCIMYYSFTAPRHVDGSLIRFLSWQGQLMEKDNIDKIRHIPCVAVQGAADLICPPGTALDLRESSTLTPSFSSHSLPPPSPPASPNLPSLPLSSSSDTTSH